MRLYRIAIRSSVAFGSRESRPRPVRGLVIRPARSQRMLRNLVPRCHHVTNHAAHVAAPARLRCEECAVESWPGTGDDGGCWDAGTHGAPVADMPCWSRGMMKLMQLTSSVSIATRWGFLIIFLMLSRSAFSDQVRARTDLSLASTLLTAERRSFLQGYISRFLRPRRQSSNRSVAGIVVHRQNRS